MTESAAMSYEEEIGRFAHRITTCNEKTLTVSAEQRARGARGFVLPSGGLSSPLAGPPPLTVERSPMSSAVCGFGRADYQRDRADGRKSLGERLDRCGFRPRARWTLDSLGADNRRRPDFRNWKGRLRGGRTGLRRRTHKARCVTGSGSALKSAVLGERSRGLS